MRRVTLLSDIFVLLGILTVLLGHFRYTRRVSLATTRRAIPERKRLSLPVAATAAVFAGTALLTSAARKAAA